MHDIALRSGFRRDEVNGGYEIGLRVPISIEKRMRADKQLPGPAITLLLSARGWIDERRLYSRIGSMRGGGESR